MGVTPPHFLRKPSVILCLVGKSLHNDNSMSVFRGSLKLKLFFRMDIVVGLFCFKNDFNVLTLPLNLYVMIDYLQSIPSVNFSCHTPALKSSSARHCLCLVVICQKFSRCLELLQQGSLPICFIPLLLLLIN